MGGDFSQYKGFDFLIGGSPCTYWSISKKRGRETTASGIGWELFSQYVRALCQARPRYFIYENNKSMSKQIRDSIRSVFGFDEICINSSLLSAQNRERYYWVGRRLQDGSYERIDVRQPQDMGIMLKDVLDGVAIREKSRCMTSSIARTTPREFIIKHQNTMSVEPVGVCSNGKAYALTATYGKCPSIINTLTRHQRTMAAEPVCRSLKRVGSLPSPDGILSNSAAFRIYDIEAKGRYVCASNGGAGAGTGLYAIPVEDDIKFYASPTKFDEDGNPIMAISYADSKEHEVYFVKDKLISVKGGLYPINLNDGFYVIRKLTVEECKRLQTVPSWYTFPVSDTQAFKMLGNGWTVSVISWLIKACLDT